MPQKIDVHGLFIDPESITDLHLQKRISVFSPVFYEVAPKMSMRLFSASQQKHFLQFDHLEPYGIILADNERPDTASYVVNYKEAVADKIFKGILKTGKNVAGHIAEALKIEISGDRQYRILQCGRIVKLTSIREIPAKVHLLNGQLVDAFKSSPKYDFQGGDPYAVTDATAYALMIKTKDKCFELFGAGIDVSNDELLSIYHSLGIIYNDIQHKRDVAIANKKNKLRLHLPQMRNPLPHVLSKRQETNSPEELAKVSNDSSPIDDSI